MDMGTVWLGFKLAIGLALGFWLVRRLVSVVSDLRLQYRFLGTDCSYQDGRNNPGIPTGWLTRDVRNNDWILWDVNSHVSLRCSDEDPPNTPWRVSNETLDQFLELARRYKDLWEKNPTG